MEKTPREGEVQESSSELKKLPIVELDLSLIDIEYENPLPTLLRVFEAASLGVGVASLSYPLVEQVAGSLALRGGAGVLASLAFLKLDRKLTESMNSVSSAKSKYSQLIANISRSGLKTAAFLAFLPTLSATWSDLLKNEETAYKMETIRDRIEVYRANPGVTPAFLDVQSDFQKDIISSLGDDESLTPQALAKMALYNDGEFVRWNVVEEGVWDEGGVSQERSWTFSDRGEAWKIVYSVNTNNWLVMGPHNSWEVGPDLEGEVVGGTLLDKFPDSPVVSYLEWDLSESGLIDGKPAIEDLLNQLKRPEPIPSGFEDRLNKLLEISRGFLPSEWNRASRVESLEYAKQIESAYVDGYASAAAVIKEREFGVAAAEDFHSYHSTLFVIDNSK